MPSAVEIIRAKRDGHRLPDESIDWIVDAYTRGEVADEQMAALAMAILLRGLDSAETDRWTGAMVASGEVLDLSGLDRPTVDKHSTGGVGDKVTLVLTPLLAACGAAVPQLSGRGLGHTGGTLDKLESIPGWCATLSGERIVRQLREVGAVVCAASQQLAPADRKLYALRDGTGTVESLPLIASSIISKKIAEGTGALVLDVKFGSGALATSPDEARALAETLVRLGVAHGLRTSALLTAMDAPLGRTAGNAIEVAEAVEVLRGGGPSDVVELVLALAREMLALAGLSGARPADVLASGEAYEVWCRMVRAQEGDPGARLPFARQQHTVLADRSGTLRRLGAREVGTAAWRLGAGRTRPGEPVDPGAGVRCLAKPGEYVQQGQPLLELRAERAGAFAAAVADLDTAVEIGHEPPCRGSLIRETVRPP